MDGKKIGWWHLGAAGFCAQKYLFRKSPFAIYSRTLDNWHTKGEKPG